MTLRELLDILESLNCPLEYKVVYVQDEDYLEYYKIEISFNHDKKIIYLHLTDGS